MTGKVRNLQSAVELVHLLMSIENNAAAAEYTVNQDESVTMLKKQVTAQVNLKSHQRGSCMPSYKCLTFDT